MSWDAFQREALSELGLELFEIGGANAPATHAKPEAPADVLMRHLLKAAGGNPARESQVLALVQPLSGLRGNAAAKRALWPLLRGLRRQ